MPILSVLDQSPIRSGGTAADAIHETLELAQICEHLGYHRYWLAEHHSSPGLAGTSPEVLIGQVAGRTARIRVGSGGVMLQHSSAPLAAHYGLAFSFAHFISHEGGPEITQAYRRYFRPSPYLAAPRSSVAVFAVCAETEAEAVRLARSRELFLLRLYTNRLAPYPSVEDAETHPYTEREMEIVQH